MLWSEERCKEDLIHVKELDDFDKNDLDDRGCWFPENEKIYRELGTSSVSEENFPVPSSGAEGLYVRWVIWWNYPACTLPFMWSKPIDFTSLFFRD